MTSSDGVPLQVRVTHASRVKGLAKLVPAEPTAHSSFPGVPIIRPRSYHRVYPLPRVPLSG
jgi:hypothetical protein